MPLPIGEMVTFLINHISLIACIVLLILSYKNSVFSRISETFMILIASMLLLNVGTLLQTYSRIFLFGGTFVYITITYVSISFFPVLIFLFGLFFKNPHMTLRPIHFMLSLFPLLSLTFITVPYLRDTYFFIHYSTYSNEAVYGQFYYIHSIYSYAFISVGIVNIISASIKSSGFFSKQSIIILLGIIVSVTANVLYSFNIVRLTFDITACAFTVAVLCFSVAIIKYKFLSVVPIALKKVVDIISDGFLVIDTDFKVVDYNNAIFKLFNNTIKLNVNDDIRKVVSKGYGNFMNSAEIEENCMAIIRTGLQVNTEKHFKTVNFDKYFTIEFSPVFTNSGKIGIVGIIILFKDVTQERKDLELIRETMAVMLERERLATLGQMVGGIAHNFKTPIMSISGGLEAIKDLALEYSSSIDDPGVTSEDHQEISREIIDWVSKTKTYCAYISDIITTIKGQAVSLNTQGMNQQFEIDEFVKRLDLLMKHELKMYHCTLNITLDIDTKTLINGEVNSLVQIFDNMILNSIHSYGGKEGVIDLSIRANSENDAIVFELSDYGSGMPEHVKNKLFKEMITTKGKDGTGLGLYMSYATIKGNFNGSMDVRSVPNEGTTFIITIPYVKA